MSNHRELFERLSKCNLPAGLRVTLGDYLNVRIGQEWEVFTWRKAWECRAALMLIVDAMRAEGWRFEFHDEPDAFYVESEHDRTCRVFTYRAQDEVTALAECLIAALGVAE